MQKDIVTIIFGDSIAYGLYDMEKFGWTNRIKEKITNNNFIFNLAIPGQNSIDILNKFELELKNRYNDQDEFKIIFSFGIKDTLLLSKNNNHLKKFKENILKIIEITNKYTKDISFIGLIKPDINIRKEYNIDDVFKIDELLENICKLKMIKHISLINIIKNDELVDGLHPNNIGHKKIFELVLKELYKEK